MSDRLTSNRGSSVHPQSVPQELVESVAEFVRRHIRLIQAELSRLFSLWSLRRRDHRQP
jgi:hypothetical protein